MVVDGDGDVAGTGETFVDVEAGFCGVVTGAVWIFDGSTGVGVEEGEGEVLGIFEIGKGEITFGFEEAVSDVPFLEG